MTKISKLNAHSIFNSPTRLLGNYIFKDTPGKFTSDGSFIPKSFSGFLPCEILKDPLALLAPGLEQRQNKEVYSRSPILGVHANSAWTSKLRAPSCSGIILPQLHHEMKERREHGGKKGKRNILPSFIFI